MCTPGAIDAAVTQANIHATICVSGYTTTVRPAESVTEAFKVADEKAYGISSGELDHLIPLEIGGSSDAHNLWVEPGSIPNPKDTVENDLHAAVCSGQLSLAAAQQLIATDWTTALAKIGENAPAATPPAPTTASAPKTTAPAAAALSCTASMSNPHPAKRSTTDVLVATAAGAGVTASAHYKTTVTTHTGAADGSGHASIAFNIGGATTGYTVTVEVTVSSGAHTASCSTSFTPS